MLTKGDKMTVKQLIEQLSKLNPELKVVIDTSENFTDIEAPVGLLADTHAVIYCGQKLI
jgi:acetolactate synthase small subunit